MTETDCCRTCLSEDDLSPIFSRQEHCERYTFALFLTTGLQIELNDKLSQKICKTCVEAINTSLQFRQKCHESEKILILRSNGLGAKVHNIIDVKVENIDDHSWSDDDFEPFESETDKYVIKEEINVEFQDDEQKASKRKKAKLKKDSKIFLNELTAEFIAGVKFEQKRKKSNLKKESRNSNDFNNFSSDTELSTIKKKKKFKLKKNSKKLLDATAENSHDFEVKTNVKAKKGKLKTELTNNLDEIQAETQTNGLCLDVDTLKLKIQNSESAKALREDKKKMFESLIVGGRQGNGPFECKVCGKVLKIWSSFRTHAKIHVGFDFMCEHCGKKFVAVTMLRRHLMALHGAEKTYVCNVCGHKEHNSDRLKIHMRRMHTGERPYICDKCGADFFSRRYLIFHLAVHETQRNFQCPQCAARFKSPQRLACHVSKVHRHRNSRLGCYLCECSYTKRENVKRHVVKVHGAASWHRSRVRRVTVGAKAFEVK